MIFLCMNNILSSHKTKIMHHREILYIHFMSSHICCCGQRIIHKKGFKNQFYARILIELSQLQPQRLQSIYSLNLVYCTNSRLFNTKFIEILFEQNVEWIAVLFYACRYAFIKNKIDKFHTKKTVWSSDVRRKL